MLDMSLLMLSLLVAIPMITLVGLLTDHLLNAQREKALIPVKSRHR